MDGIDNCGNIEGMEYAQINLGCNEDIWMVGM